MTRDELNEFESIYDYKIPKHTTVVIRVDGKNFKRVTEKLNKPFDNVFSTIMESTMNQVAPQISGCDIAYFQSDEITFIIHNKENASPFLGNRIQKMASIVASTVSVTFYKLFLSFIMDYQDRIALIGEDDREKMKDELETRINSLWSVINANPVFDAKVFLIPEEDEEDVLEIRQNNCIANSINTMAHYYLGKKTVKGKSQEDLLKELYKNGHRWEDLPEVVKFGSCIIRQPQEVQRGENTVVRNVWVHAYLRGVKAKRLEIDEANRVEAKKLKEEKENETTESEA